MRPGASPTLLLLLAALATLPARGGKPVRPAIAADGFLSSYRNCYLPAPVREDLGCRRLASKKGDDFGLNEHRQETTGKQICLDLARAAGGDTFVFEVGRCEAWRCGTRDALRASTAAKAVPHGSNGSASSPARGNQSAAAAVWVYSELCEFQEGTGGPGGAERRAPIFVQLFEWAYRDVARECEVYLGPNGFDAVQVSPVAEHIQGFQWWAKYQPISFGLNSRSGSAAEFAEMVARCRAAGVQVVVDLILNHIAAGCPEAMKTKRDPTKDPMPCTGWNGTKFGNRRTAGARGWDAAGNDYFHHDLNSKVDGLCGVGEPSFLCGSLVTTDCSCCRCDLYGLPDWNTGMMEVLTIHDRHVAELHNLGVTMLRIDAALYEDVGQLSRVLNRYPWDYVYMEWWGEMPVGLHDKYIGQYRDVAYRWKICNALAGDRDISRLPQLLDLTWGVFGVKPDKALYPMAFHDQRTEGFDPTIATYKNGLEYHQQQKFLMVWPQTVRIMLWGGYGYLTSDDGPPGCEPGQAKCTPLPVFDKEGAADCMPTPTQSPLPPEVAFQHRWVCEHRWSGVAGLVGFRRACRGLPVKHVPEGKPGRLGFRVGEECFVALVRGQNTMFPQTFGPLGDWPLAGVNVGLPAGRYCDVASLSAKLPAGATKCAREVAVGSDGVALSGTVVEGDLLAIYTGARLGDVAVALAADAAPPPRRLRSLSV